MPALETLDAIQRRRLEAMLASTRWRLIIGGAIVAAGLAGGVLVGVFGGLLFAAAGGAIAFLIARHKARSSALNDFLTAWGAQRGLTFEEEPEIPRTTELLRRGDKRELENGLRGTLCSFPGCLFQYTYITTSTDSNGNRSEHRYPHTVVLLETAQRLIPRMTVHPRAWLDNRFFDKLDTTLTKDRVVELESTEMHDRYKIEVADATDDMLVRRVFEPSFMIWCLDQQDPAALFELEDGVLVIAVKGHLDDERKLEALVAQAETVSRYVTRVAPLGAAT